MAEGSSADAPAVSRGADAQWMEEWTHEPEPVRQELVTDAVVFTREDAAQLRLSGAYMSMKEAHTGLNACRERFPSDGSDVNDPSAVFDWRLYLASHPNCDELIGSGVKSFWFCWLRHTDPNTRELRSDFVVRTADGDVRLHPQSKKNCKGVKEALHVHGNLDIWLRRPLATSQGPGSSQEDIWPTELARLTERRLEPYHTIAASDTNTYGRAKAVQFLQDYTTAWLTSPDPRADFSWDLTNGRPYCRRSLLYNSVFGFSSIRFDEST